MVVVMASHATILENQKSIELALGHQHDCIEALKREVAGASAILAEIKALMSTLHVMGAVTRWGVVVTAAVLSAWQGIKAMFHFFK